MGSSQTYNFPYCICLALVGNPSHYAQMYQAKSLADAEMQRRTKNLLGSEAQNDLFVMSCHSLMLDQNFIK